MSMRAAAIVAGVGQTTYWKWGQAPEPEFKLALRAIMAACEDAGISPAEIDGFSSYSNDRSEASRPAVRFSTRLGNVRPPTASNSP